MSHCFYCQSIMDEKKDNQFVFHKECISIYIGYCEYYECPNCGHQTFSGEYVDIIINKINDQLQSLL